VFNQRAGSIQHVRKKYDSPVVNLW